MADHLRDATKMIDYISREAALACFTDWIDRHGHEHTADETVEYQKIEALPEENVRPVVRGKWIDIRPINQSTFERIAIKGAYNKCSLCGRLCFFPENFCPKCGADMREADADGES